MDSCFTFVICYYELMPCTNIMKAWYHNDNVYIKNTVLVIKKRLSNLLLARCRLLEGIIILS